MPISLTLKRISTHDLPIPKQQNPGDAGFDLQCAEADPITLQGGSWRLIKTGFAWAISHGYVGQVCPRSGLAVKYGITVLNGPGIVDSGFRGEVCVALVNHHHQPYTIHYGDRIAQMLIVPVLSPQLEECDQLDETTRGIAGFGSSGQ